MSLDLDTLSGPIDPTEPGFQTLLAHLQGNILKSHGRNCTINLFLTFEKGKKDAVGAWIGDFTRNYVTSALRQLHESAEFKANKLSGRVFASLSFSAAGYVYLEKELTAFVERRSTPTSPASFKSGMKAAQAALKDPLPTEWEFNREGEVVHAMILLADEKRKQLNLRKDEIIADLKGRGILASFFEQPGIGLRDENNQPLEHFGYRDGVSQPLFYTQDVTEEEQRFGISSWDPSASLSLVLVPDPFASTPESFGSFLVFRKLEQDVLKFKTLEKNLADKLAQEAQTKGLPPFPEELAGAEVVGRFENGIPVEVTGSDQALQYRDFNDFNYHQDLKPQRCPFQAHIRKTNPRGDTLRVLLRDDPHTVEEAQAIDEQERARRIARRGITYGARKLNAQCQLIPPELKPDGTLDPPITEPVGLLFQCYQSSIPDQFGFIQIGWANNPNFPDKKVGIDPVIGQGKPGDLPQKWLPEYDSPDNALEFPFGEVVKMRGGEFFFTPSIPFLLNFGQEDPGVDADTNEYAQKLLFS